MLSACDRMLPAFRLPAAGWYNNHRSFDFTIFYNLLLHQFTQEMDDNELQLLNMLGVCGRNHHGDISERTELTAITTKQCDATHAAATGSLKRAEKIVRATSGTQPD